MFDYQVGDYILTRDGELYRVINKYSQSIGVYYDVKSLKPVYRTYYAKDGHTIEYTEDFTTHHSLPLNHLRHFGMRITEENAKLAKILYG
jgi:hypothetical protein